jgi:ribosomal protein S27E
MMHSTVAAAPLSPSTGGASDAGSSFNRARQKLRQLHDELTECPICLGEFCVPKQLPCMHTYCLACLKRMTARRDTGDRVPCPVCSQTFVLPPGGVEALPKNYVVDRLVELLRTASIPVSVETAVYSRCGR